MHILVACCLARHGLDHGDCVYEFLVRTTEKGLTDAVRLSVEDELYCSGRIVVCGKEYKRISM